MNSMSELKSIKLFWVLSQFAFFFIIINVFDGNEWTSFVFVVGLFVIGVIFNKASQNVPCDHCGKCLNVGVLDVFLNKSCRSCEKHDV